MKRVFLFDVDGTLTPARGKIDSEFESFMLEFMETNNVYLVSGSDRGKTLEQIGQRLYDKCISVYQCNGNEKWKKDFRLHAENWIPEYEMTHFLEGLQENSRYPVKTGRHVERRTGMINFSTVGRNATQDQRKAYFAWDKETQERAIIVRALTTKFKTINASIGGEISIDIYPKGNDKSRVAKELTEEYDEIMFFGDRCKHGGNDYAIATTIRLSETGTVHEVDGWEHTWELLKGYQDART